MKPRVYLETTIVSYLTARPSRDLIVAAHQQVTREWWERRRTGFRLYISQLVLQEARLGDPQAAEARLRELAKIQVLAGTEAVLALTDDLVRDGPLPRKAADALHIATAAVHEMNYLLTWNCRHIANAEFQPVVNWICASRGYTAPVICTPEELMGT